MLVGRNAEFGGLLDVVHRAVAGRGSAVCVEGEPGIAKTVLVDAVVDAALPTHPAIQIVRAIDVESEFSLAHAGLVDLLAPMLGRLDALPAGQRQALAPALGRSESSAGADRFLVAFAMLALISVHAEEHPLVLVIDDLQWRDPETRAALQFSARRLRYDAVVVLLTRRRLPGAEPDDDLAWIDRLTLPGSATGPTPSGCWRDRSRSTRSVRWSRGPAAIRSRCCRRPRPIDARLMRRLATVNEHRPGSRLRHIAEASSGPDDALGTELLTLAAAERSRSGHAAASVIAERASSLLSRPGPCVDALADAVEGPGTGCWARRHIARFPLCPGCPTRSPVRSLPAAATGGPRSRPPRLPARPSPGRGTTVSQSGSCTPRSSNRTQQLAGQHDLLERADRRRVFSERISTRDRSDPSWRRCSP